MVATKDSSDERLATSNERRAMKRRTAKRPPDDSQFLRIATRRTGGVALNGPHAKSPTGSARAGTRTGAHSRVPPTSIGPVHRALGGSQTKRPVRVSRTGRRPTSLLVAHRPL